MYQNGGGQIVRTIRESDGGRLIVTMIGLGVGVWYGRFGKAEGRTADPSTTLRSGRDDKGGGGAFSVRVWDERFGKAEGRTADPSAPLRSGRDDNFVWER